MLPPQRIRVEVDVFGKESERIDQGDCTLACAGQGEGLQRRVVSLNESDQAAGFDEKGSGVVEGMDCGIACGTFLGEMSDLDGMGLGNQGDVAAGDGIGAVLNEDIEAELVWGGPGVGKECGDARKADGGQTSRQWSHDMRRKRRVQLDDSDDEDVDENGVKEVGSGQGVVGNKDRNGDWSGGEKSEEGDEVDEMDEEDELARFIQLRMDSDQAQADGLMDDRLEGDNAPAMNSEDDDSELNENLIEDDLEDNIPEQPLANLAETGDRLGGEWIPDVKPLTSLMERIQQQHQETVNRANEVLKQRDARKQEKIREELEHIKLYMAGEAGFDSEDECHQVEIVPNDAPLQHIALVQTESTDGELSDISDGLSEKSEEELDNCAGDSSEPQGSEQADLETSISVECAASDEEEPTAEMSPSVEIGVQNPSTTGNPVVVEINHSHDEEQLCSQSNENEPPNKPFGIREMDDNVLVAPDPVVSGFCDRGQAIHTEITPDNPAQSTRSLVDDMSPAKEDLTAADAIVDDQGKHKAVRKRLFRLKDAGIQDHASAAQRFDRSKSFVEHEAEMSEDDGHTDDEDDDEMDEELAEFLAGEEAANEDEGVHDEAHKHWEIRQDDKELKDIVAGVRDGWKRKKRTASHLALEDEDDGTLEDARRRRVAQNDSDSGSDQDDSNVGHDHMQAGAGYEESDNFSIGSLDDMSQSDDDMERARTGISDGVSASDSALGVKDFVGKGVKRAKKDVQALGLVEPGMMDMLKGAEIEPMKATQVPQSTQDKDESNTMIPFGRRRPKGHSMISDGPGIMDGFLAMESSTSIWDADDETNVGHQQAPKVFAGRSTCMAKEKNPEKSMLMSALGRQG